MELRADFLLNNALKAMTDTVLPAIDPNNKLAIEQAQLIAASISLVTQRLPLEFRYACDELNRYIELAKKLHDLCKANDGEADSQALAKVLASSINHNEQILSRTLVDPQEIQQRNHALRQTVSSAITDISAFSNTDLQKKLHTIVDTHAERELLLERAWLAPQGWEAGNDMPDICELLSASKS